ncbi:MAG: 30S ribosomal protein S2 [Candidatus Diapherotrites archaeon]|nr:30S ribosomal protein S2 [Candidatus Diapherotrites archaeon]
MQPTNPFLSTGSHIGTVFKTGDMRRYIFKRRKDGLLVLNVENIEERLKIAAKFMARYPAGKVVVVCRRLYGTTPARKFAELTGAKLISGRFIPGTFSNAQHKKFIEPAVVLITEPEADSQAVKEATIVHAPVVALVSTNNSLRNVDLAIPINNKGRKSLALAFWTLTKELLISRQDIKNEAGMTALVEDFEYKLSAQGGEEDPVKQAIMEGRQLRRKRFSGARKEGDRPMRTFRRPE